MPLRKSDFGLRKTGVSEIGNTGLPNATSLTRHSIPGECGIRRGFGGVNIWIITGLSVTSISVGYNIVEDIVEAG